MGLSVWRETSKKLPVYRVCYTPIETLLVGCDFNVRMLVSRFLGFIELLVRVATTIDNTP